MIDPLDEKPLIGQAIDVVLTLLIILLLMAWCLQILAPFLSLVVWGGVIAVALYPVFLKVTGWFGGHHKLTVALFVLIGFALVVVPMWSLTASLLTAAQALKVHLVDGSLVVPPLPEKVAQWPLLGARLDAAWTELSTNLSGFFAEHEMQVRNIASATLSRITGAGLGALQLIVSIVIGGVLMLGAEKSTAAARLLATRFAGERGESLRKLAVQTIRSVAVGVLGIAIIQAILGGLGMVFAGVPAAGLWALLVLVLAIAQLPPLVVLGPAAVYVFSVQSTTVSIVFLIWSIVVSFSDAVLKPMFLGRGVDVPMLVILLGAIGGMLTSGIIGLFVGAVVLALGYQLLQFWLEAGAKPAPAEHDALPAGES